MSSTAYRLHIENVLTIDEMDLDLSPGVQGFVGPNAAGKTNVLTAVQAILSGKHDARLIKDGQKRSEIRLEEISDGEVLRSVSRIQTETASRLQGQGLTHTSPKKWLTGLLDEIAINPIRLISEDPVKYLKQHLPIGVEPDEIVDAPGVTIEFNVEGNSFYECERIAEDIGVTRRAQYQIYRHAKEVADELRKNLNPLPDEPKFTQEELDKDRAEVRAKEMRIDEHNKRREEIEEHIKGTEKERDFHRSRIDDDKKRCAYLDQEVLNLEQQKKDEIAKVEAMFKERHADVEQKRSALLQRIEVDQEHVERTTKEVQKLHEAHSNTPVMTKIELEKESMQIDERAKQLRDFIELKRRHDHLAEKDADFFDAKDLYGVLDERYKWYAYDLPKRLVNRANLPVEGLEFREEELYVNDRHIDRLSSAERHIVAVKLAVALAKMKGHIAVCIDGIEILDEEHRREMMDAIKDQGLRVLYTRHGEPEYQHEIKIGANDGETDN